MLASLTRECFTSRMIRTMDLRVAVHTTFVEGEDVESRHGLMTPQHMNVALLAQLVGARSQQTDVVRAVGRMTGEAVLSHRRMLPQHRAALIRVALITKLIRCARLEHFAAFSPMRIVTRRAGHFHAHRLTVQELSLARGNKILSAEKMGRALEKGLALFLVATETCFLDG